MKFRALLAATACAVALFFGAVPVSAEVYFDAHNHITGILPYYAYADLPAFIEHTAFDSNAVTFEERYALYRYLKDTWYPSHEPALGDRLFSPPDGQRFSLGARAALAVYGEPIAGSVAGVDGILERVLSATPWTEFDSAYAFRGGPASDYLRSRFYGGDEARLQADLCKATILDLAATNIGISEQSLPFIGGWGMRNGRSERLDTIECVQNEPSNPALVAAFRAMDKPAPVVTIVLMTHTSQLATLPGAATYSEWSKNGRCAPVTLPRALVTAPKTIYNALLAQDGAGAPVVPPARRSRFFDTVTGIDTAAPETTCFTPDGMNYYKQLVGAVYDAAKERRRDGWHGKLLVHTHVGEGSVIDFAPVPPPQPWTFADTFGALPSTLTNSAQARDNITVLLAAIAQFEASHPDVHRYLVFRLAHDTWADPSQAQAMHDAGVEADVNLESNVATGAYPMSRMPLGIEAIMRDDVGPLLANQQSNFELNDLLRTLIPDPNDALQVGSVLGNASLKYLLEKHVRCLLGTDADGVEHSDIVKEYEYAGSLVAYWNRTDPSFRAAAASDGERTLFDNVRWHLKNMASDAAEPY
jgi:hypothetical protein